MSKGVFVYRNLNRSGVVWSVKSLRTGKVIARKSYVMIRDAELKVSLKGNKRAKKHRRRNVHAGIKGTLISSGFKHYVNDTRGLIKGWERITYKPFGAATFIKTDGTPVTTASLVVLSHDGAFALDPK